MSEMFLASKYNRNDFISFLSQKFLPTDFESSQAKIVIDRTNSIIKNANKLGACPSLELSVYEFKHNSNHDPRVNLSRESFNILKNDTEPNALAVFFNEDTSQWRLSLITSDYSPGKKKGRVNREFSNPRRFSYLLGENCKLHTPESMLYKDYRVKSEEDLISRFAIEVVTKQFYKELFNWYDTWAVKKVKFPTGIGKDAKLPSKPDVEKNRQHLIRLITRFIFVWFLKQKDNLVPNKLFDENEISKILNKFDAHSEEQGNYYNGVIQNLFFATLNKPIQERRFASKDEEDRKEDYGIKTKFRDFNKKSIFSNDYNPVNNPQKFIDLFSTIPFLNGGLFECLDNFDTKEYKDGFSREEKRAAFIPNCLFWGDNDHEGLIPLLKRYNFTIEENTPQDIDIALDPELLGKVFENLLGTYNEETSSTARNESGSFYTPREIVDYMVDSSLKEYLKGKLNSKEDTIDEKLGKLFSYHETDHNFSSTEVKIIMDAINECKILDPACGSGAFPMGILNKLCFIMQKLDPKNEVWRDNYARKLFLIENCIYGVDIQPIAIQISKLRFFISLIVDQKTSKNINNNYNVIPLPNLETKFVAANTLIGIKRIKKGDQVYLGDDEIKLKQNEILGVRHSHFSARDAKEKINLRKKDETLCKELIELLKKDGFCTLSDAEQLARWNPYNQTEPADFFDPTWMFGLTNENTSFSSTTQNEGFFDIVIGNPPYGAKYSESAKEYFKKYFKSAKTIQGQQKGSLNTFTLFIEKGYDIVKINGILYYIVPMSVISSDAVTALHNLLLTHCEKIKVASFSERPIQPFPNACQATSILFFQRTSTPCKLLLTTKKNRLNKMIELKNLIENLKFIQGQDNRLYGRIPKISLDIEHNILSKLFSNNNQTISNLIDNNGTLIYYRMAGGRYFKVITNYSTNSSAEKSIRISKKYADCVGFFMSSSFFWWYVQVYADDHNLKSYEIENFRIPVEKITKSNVNVFTNLYNLYLKDIETNARINSKGIKEYKIRKSRHIIDQIDDLICPLYGLTQEETDFIKNYEIEFRSDQDD